MTELSITTLYLKDSYGLDLDDDQMKLLCYGCIKKWSEVHSYEWNSYRLFSIIPIMIQEIIVRFLEENDEFTVSNNCKKIINNGKAFTDVGLLKIPKIHSKDYRGVEHQWHFNVHGTCSIGLTSRSRLAKPQSLIHPSTAGAFIDIVDNLSVIISMKLTIVKSKTKQLTTVEFFKDGVGMKTQLYNKSIATALSSKYWRMCVEGDKQIYGRVITLQTFSKKKIY